MPERIILQGDKVKAASFLGWARSKLFMLKANMDILDIKQDRKFFALDGLNVFISSLFGDDEIRIVGESGAFVYVPEWSYEASFLLPRIQIFDFNSNYINESSDPENLFAGEKYAFDVAFYGNSLYSTNWWGYVHKFTVDGIFLGEEYLVDKVKIGGGKALEQIAIGGDKIAISANFKSNLKWIYFFDINYNYLFDVSLLPVWTTGSQGVEIYNNKVFAAWSAEYVGGYYGIWEYNLTDGVFTASFEDDETLGMFASSLSAYNGILYAADTQKDQIVKYDIATRTIVGKIDLTTFMPADISPRGLAAGSSGLWITAFKYDGSLHPELPVKLYHCDLNGTLIKEIGAYGTGQSQFKAPFGVALKEVA